jgi:hypothetical protein
VSIFFAGILSIPKDNKEYQISVRIADKEWNSGPPKSAKAKYNRHNVKPTENDEIVRFPYINI